MAQSRASSDPDLAGEFAAGSIDLAELNRRAADAGREATKATAAPPTRDRADKLTDAG